ncbi:MAG: hypothetical protein KatS3mg098_407 [Candidatus Parcubacteria bacterium]|nr:tRNA pseudouridine(55) synthase TruB [Patescibacteria group bacterium]BCX16178.1 MAG: hypothetical protein KatS3mg098_407 [Candidatus Parcubacteria bacterium]
MIEGFFLLNKPSGISSAKFLNKFKLSLKEILKENFQKKTKIGHGGTLDPFANGLLITAVGREFTKSLFLFLKKLDKTYQAKIVLGVSSSTDDIEGEKIFHSLKRLPSCQEIEVAINQLAQKRTQKPPRFSAVKIKGTPAYKLSRQKINFEVKEKEVSLISYKIKSVSYLKETIELELELKVSAGFYVRSFARDLGEILKTGGYVKELTRTKIGYFSLDSALALEDLKGAIEMNFEAKGKVQGVGYRFLALQSASNLGIKGFCCNLVDLPAIRVVAQGDLISLSRFLEILKKGPPSAQIEELKIFFQKPTFLRENFEIIEDQIS